MHLRAGVLAAGLVASACTQAAGTQEQLPPPPPSVTLVAHATGDVLLRPGDPWTSVRSMFRADDVTIVNLECAPGTGGAPEVKQYLFRCADGTAQSVMRAGGVDVVNLGNNHSQDFGPAAMLDGRARLTRAGLAVVGAGHDAAEANAPAIFERGGRTIAVLGFSRVVPYARWTAKANHPGTASGYSISSMVAAVRSARARADVVFATIHWGDEGKTVPLDEDVERAHALIDAGAAAVFGHHAHVLQPLEFYKGRPIFFGLGNFVWPRDGATAIAEVRVSTNGAVTACLIPARITDGRPAASRAAC